jgi:hypothetical protein
VYSLAETHSAAVIADALSDQESMHPHFRRALLPVTERIQHDLHVHVHLTEFLSTIPHLIDVGVLDRLLIRVESSRGYESAIQMSRVAPGDQRSSSVLGRGFSYDPPHVQML